MVEEARIKVVLDRAQARRELERAKKQEAKRQEAPGRQPGPRVKKSKIESMSNELKRRRAGVLSNADQARFMKRMAPGGMEALVGGRIGIGAFAVTRGRELTRKAFGADKPKLAGEAGRQRMARFGRVVGKATVVAAAINTIINTGLPVMSEFLSSGVKDIALEAGPEAGAATQATADVLTEITDFVQNIKAELSAIGRSFSDGKELLSGYTLVGSDLGKIPLAFNGVHTVNKFEEKLQMDLSEAAMRERVGNVGSFVREGITSILEEMFGGRQED